MAQSNLFNGWLNTILAPHLIQANEGVIYQNIDNSLGVVADYVNEFIKFSKSLNARAPMVLFKGLANAYTETSGVAKLYQEDIKC